MFYAVRIEGTKEAVGLLFVERRGDLFDLVDELCDPYICECKRIEGGIFWEKTDLKFGDTDYVRSVFLHGNGNGNDEAVEDYDEVDDEVDFLLDFSDAKSSEGLLESVSSTKGWSLVVDDRYGYKGSF